MNKPVSAFTGTITSENPALDIVIVPSPYDSLALPETVIGADTVTEVAEFPTFKKQDYAALGATAAALMIPGLREHTLSTLQDPGVILDDLNSSWEAVKTLGAGVRDGIIQFGQKYDLIADSGNSLSERAGLPTEPQYPTEPVRLFDPIEPEVFNTTAPTE